MADGTCQDGLLESQCTGTFRGENTTCGTDGAICRGACCKGEANGCVDTTVNECLQPFTFKGFGTRCATVACPCNDPFADADLDGDVDQFDFAIFQSCFQGPGVVVGGVCRCFDRHPGGSGDGDIDGEDLVKFELCASGPGIPLNPICDTQ